MIRPKLNLGVMDYLWQCFHDCVWRVQLARVFIGTGDGW